MPAHSPLRWLIQKQQKPALEFERMFSLREAACLLGIGPLALRRATKAGLIHAVRLHDRAHFKYRESELRKYLEPAQQDPKENK
jgi:hypothetical protein